MRIKMRIKGSILSLTDKTRLIAVVMLPSGEQFLLHFCSYVNQNAGKMQANPPIRDHIPHSHRVPETFATFSRPIILDRCGKGVGDFMKVMKRVEARMNRTRRKCLIRGESRLSERDGAPEIVFVQNRGASRIRNGLDHAASSHRYLHLSTCRGIFDTGVRGADHPPDLFRWIPHLARIKKSRVVKVRINEAAHAWACHSS